MGRSTARFDLSDWLSGTKSSKRTAAACTSLLCAPMGAEGDQAASLDPRDDGEGRIKEGAGPGARRFWLWLLAITGIAFVGRVAYILTVARHDDHVYDAFLYLGVSELITEGHGFVTPLFGGPEASHPPLTMLAIVPASAFTDLTSGYVAQRVTMAVLGAISVVVIGLLGRAVVSARVGLVAAALAAVYPNIWLANTVVMAESLAILFTALAVLTTYRFLRRPTWWCAALVGVLCGLAALTRAELLLLAPMLVLPAVLVTKDLTRRDQLARVGVAALACVLVMAPWVVRNLTTYREPTFLSTGDGTSLLSTNCEATYYGHNLGLSELECALRVREKGDQSVVSKRRRQVALEYAGDHLGRLPLVVAVRVLRMWDLYRPVQGVDLNTVEGRGKTAGLVGLGMYYVLGLLTIAGAVVLRRRRTTVWPLLVPIVLATVIAITTQGAVRYRAPAEVSLVVLAAVALDALWTRYAGRRAAVEVSEGQA
jgi:4-amino-4-deoxy-L-arabinose transferase-like glycosyltransferase